MKRNDLPLHDIPRSPDTTRWADNAGLHTLAAIDKAKDLLK